MLAGISADEADAWKETDLPSNAVRVIEAESQVVRCISEL